MWTTARLDLSDPAWVDHVSTHPEAQPFHHPSWGEFIARVYGFGAFALVVMDERGAVVGGLPVIEKNRHHWVSLPFTDSCPPLAPDGDGRLFTAVIDQARRAAGARLIVHAPLAGSPFSSNVACIQTLDLAPGPERLARAFNRSQVRRQIRAAEKSGLELRRADCAEQVSGDYYRLHLMTRRRQGVPVQPRKFFQRLWTDVLEPGLGEALLAYSDDIAVAGAILLSWKGTTVYKYGASDRRYRQLHANHLIFWSAIQNRCAQGDHMFDFGRTDLRNGGLRAFKSRWGCVERPLIHSTLADRPPTPSRGVAQRVAAPMIRHSPEFVCQAAGELLYKYAA
jgi:CelD/BcsL family acetyltransferase involved in cellulose biosynthesis